jgi:hypothetical protein
LSSLSAVSWTSGGVAHQAVSTIGADAAVYLTVDATGNERLGGDAKQISAGLDTSGRPEVFAVGANNSIRVDRGSGWVNLGGYVRQISGTRDNTVSAIGMDDAVYAHTGTPGGLSPMGGIVKQIGAALDASGRPEVISGPLAAGSAFLLQHPVRC